VWATKEADGASLDRIQIVKGWVDRSAAQAKAQNVDRSSVQRDYQARERGAQREQTQHQVPCSKPTSAPASRPKSAPAARPTTRPTGGARPH
jgi:hypothetical protein